MKQIFRGAWAFLTAAIVLLSFDVSAQQRAKDGKGATDTIKNEQQAEEDDFVMPADAPYLTEKDRRLYHLRRVNIHGVKYLNHDILRSASGLVPGDSIYIPSSFVQNAMNRLWSQRYFSDIQIGASIEVIAFCNSAV